MIVLRSARPEEIETIRALERASAQRFVGLMDALVADEPRPAAVLAARIADGGLVVAVEHQAIAGFAMFRPVEHRLYVEQIDVLPAFAGRRIGAALLDAVTEQARTAGLVGLSLSTFRKIPWNAPYYRRLGFVEVAALTPAMAAIRAEHLARGLDEDARVFMVRDV
ncbi:GNAT family N-acetyltransferase [Caulobacter sp. Root1472]|uniref:GNAT family N-acetyltransferase n=1 Tax=Caulobacter sp. Root1472 TaxID=1736470 RepID=UPI0006F4B330|nr:GNAT family N-acetyltransferase [Caulobacter sp. Root1472]KQZ27313.1 acetyltransferase [Caulobacter sp. Root1472]